MQVTDIAVRLQEECGAYAIDAAKAALARAARFADQNGISYWSEICAILATNIES